MAKDGVRIIPRAVDPITQLIDLSIDRGWHLKRAIGRDAEAGVSGELVYYVPGSENFVVLRDDILAGIKFISILGPHPESLVDGVRAEFSAWSDEELFAWWDRAAQSADVDDKVDAVLFLGVNTPRAPHDAYVRRLRAGLGDPDKDVRNAAVVAAAFADWRLLTDDLARIARSDPDDKARERAQRVLDGWAGEDRGPPPG